MTCRQHPFLCIVPPHILREIAHKGNPRQQTWALQTLTMSEQVRGQRQTVGATAAIAAAAPEGKKRRAVYDATNKDQLPGVLVREEGQAAVGDPAVDEAYDGAGATYDLYDQVFGRNSIDDRGMRLDSTVHYLEGFDNAFWNGAQMVYGDGDEDLPEADRLFNRFTICIDIIGHELTHGVTQYEANLAYRFQSGALNESFSDVIGSLVKQRVLGHTTAQADWLIGSGLFSPNVNGVALRSMKDPGTAYDDPVIGKDPQPSHMNDYKKLPFAYDNGGVHINSGIPNHAFYLAATKIGGNAWEKSGRIWYVALRDRLRHNSNFDDAARLTVQVAGELYGDGSAEQQAVRDSWGEVGIETGDKSKK